MMKKDYCKEPFRRMAAIGDSITMGANATRKEHSWVSILTGLITEFQNQEITVFNAGISGNLLSPRSSAYEDADASKPSGLERFRRDVIAHKPDLVLISYGLNDLRSGTPIYIFLEDLDVIVQQVKSETKAVIVLVGAYFITGYNSYSNVWGHADMQATQIFNAHLKEFAKTNDLLFADVYDAQGEAHWGVDKDRIHPNNLGHQLIAGKVFETIATNCSCLSTKAEKEGDAYYRQSGATERWFDEEELPLRNYKDL